MSRCLLLFDKIIRYSMGFIYFLHPKVTTASVYYQH